MLYFIFIDLMSIVIRLFALFVLVLCTITVTYSLIKTASPAIKPKWIIRNQQVLFNNERHTALFSAAEEKLELKAEKSGTGFLDGLLHRKELDSTPENTTGNDIYLSILRFSLHSQIICDFFWLPNGSLSITKN